MQYSAVSTGQSALTIPAWNVKAVTIQLLLLIAASFVLPAAAHAIGLPVRLFLPMHWPVLLAGLCYGWRSGLAIGLAAPAVSYLLSGMPPMFMLPSMTLELAVYGFVAGFSRERLKLGWIASTLAALIVGRLAFLGFTFATGAGSQPFLSYLQAAMVPGLAAALGQIVLLPLIARGWVGRK
jgi:hypothetical protein